MVLFTIKRFILPVERSLNFCDISLWCLPSINSGHMYFTKFKKSPVTSFCMFLSCVDNSRSAYSCASFSGKFFIIFFGSIISILFSNQPTITMFIKLYSVSLGPLCLFRVGPRPLYTSYLQPAVVPL